MEKLVSELLRFEIDESKRNFNGFSSSDEYTAYLNELYRNVTLSGLENEIYRNGIRVKLQDFKMLLNINLPNLIDVEAIKRDYQNNPGLKPDVEWYTMLFAIRGIKEYYKNKVLAMLKPAPHSSNIDETEQTHTEDAEEWITYDKLVANYHFKGVTSVKDAKWRKKHDFYPCKQDGKGCALRISVSLLKKWLNRGKE